jgi:ribonuclease HIII
VSRHPGPDDLSLPVIGLDEAGKGDYFGPLVVAAVAGAPARLNALGVADSKRLSDGRVKALAAAIHTEFPVEVVAVHPVKYNELYAKMRNLNRLLAWCHATALENLLTRTTARQVIVDQFAAAHVLERALKERGKAIALTQVTRGEAHASVAAASIVARAEFLDRLAGLSRRFDLDLPKGAGAPVDLAGRRILESGGEALLAQVAKLHFKNTQKIGTGT